MQMINHALLWPSKRSAFTEVMLSHCIASAFPVGTECFLLDTPPERKALEASPTPAQTDTESTQTVAAASSAHRSEANEAESGASSQSVAASDGLKGATSVEQCYSLLGTLVSR